MFERRGSTLLERDVELELLGNALGAASHGESRAVVFEGAPGMGKTALVNRAAAMAAERGVAVLRARAGVLERTLDWGIARQLFEELVVGATSAERRSLMVGAASLVGLRFDHESAASSDDDPTRGLYWLARNLAERQPLALLIDDAQWCDAASLGWLLYLARRLDGLGIAVVMAFRACEPDAPKELLDALTAEPAFATRALAPLTSEATRTVLEGLYGDLVEPEFAEACRRWTGGNPLFVTELAAELVAEGVAPVAAAVGRLPALPPPASVARVLALRLGRLSEPALELARAVSVLETAELRHAAALAGLTDVASEQALDELIDARILGAGRPIEFVHPLIGRVVYEDVRPARRANAHKAAARALAQDAVGVDRVCAHLLRATPASDPWVVDQLLAAAANGTGPRTPATSVELLRRASEEPPAPDRAGAVLLALGRAESLAGDPAASETLRHALAGCTERAARSEAALLLGRVHLRAGRAHAAVDVLRVEAEALGWEEPALRLALESLLMSAARFCDGGSALVADRLPVVRAHEAEHALARSVVAGQRAWSLTASGASARKAIESARRALADRCPGELSDDPGRLAPVHMLALCDQLHEAEQLWSEAATVAERTGSTAAYAAAASYRSTTAYLSGRLQAAEQTAREAIDAAGNSLELIRRFASAALAVALIDQGRAAEAMSALGCDLAELECSRAPWAAEAMFAAGRALVADGELRRGTELLLASGRRALESGIANPAWVSWRSEAAIGLLAQGDEPEARRISDEELELARRFGARRPLGLALRTQGLIEGGEQGLAKLRKSVGILARTGAQLEHARSLVELGCALRRANRRADSRAPLRQGLELALECGAGPLAERARTELAAAGARARNVFRIGSDALTPSERRVCVMAAAGKTNPEIAQSLFVSRATVESHLHSAYRKLDIESRSDLPVALAA